MVDWRHWRLTTRRPLLYSHYLRRYRQIHPFGLKQARKATLLTTLRTLVNKVIPWWFLPNAYRLIDITELPPLSIYLLSCLIESCGLCFLPPSSSLLSIRALPEDSGQAFPPSLPTGYQNTFAFRVYLQYWCVETKSAQEHSLGFSQHTLFLDFPEFLQNILSEKLTSFLGLLAFLIYSFLERLILNTSKQVWVPFSHPSDGLSQLTRIRFIFKIEFNVHHWSPYLLRSTSYADPCTFNQDIVPQIPRFQLWDRTWPFLTLNG